MTYAFHVTDDDMFVKGDEVERVHLVRYRLRDFCISTAKVSNNKARTPAYTDIFKLK